MPNDNQENGSRAQEEEILLAIATALHLQKNFPEGRQRITFTDDTESVWALTGKLQRLSSRKNIHIRSRK